MSSFVQCHELQCAKLTQPSLCPRVCSTSWALRNECNCTVVWTFFGIVFLWDWNENWSFPVLWLLLSFQICWHIECSTFIASSFRIWNCSTGIPSPPLPLFIVMLPKAHLTLHSRMSGSRWVITPSWLSGSWRSFLYVSSLPWFSFILSIFILHHLQILKDDAVKVLHPICQQVWKTQQWPQD